MAPLAHTVVFTDILNRFSIRNMTQGSLETALTSDLQQDKLRTSSQSDSPSEALRDFQH